LISQRTEVGRLPDIDEPVYVISRVILLPLSDVPIKDLDITVCPCVNTTCFSVLLIVKSPIIVDIKSFIWGQLNQIRRQTKDKQSIVISFNT